MLHLRGILVADPYMAITCEVDSAVGFFGTHACTIHSNMHKHFFMSACIHTDSGMFLHIYTRTHAYTVTGLDSYMDAYIHTWRLIHD